MCYDIWVIIKIPPEITQSILPFPKCFIYYFISCDTSLGPQTLGPGFALRPVDPPVALVFRLEWPLGGVFHVQMHTKMRLGTIVNISECAF